jgi:hypothetical protein
MYAEGADYVVLPRVLTARHLVEIIGEIVQNDEKKLHVFTKRADRDA